MARVFTPNPKRLVVYIKPTTAKRVPAQVTVKTSNTVIDLRTAAGQTVTGVSKRTAHNQTGVWAVP